jgi:hypothetical protein
VRHDHPPEVAGLTEWSNVDGAISHVAIVAPSWIESVGVRGRGLDASYAMRTTGDFELIADGPELVALAAGFAVAHVGAFRALASNEIGGHTVPWEEPRYQTVRGSRVVGQARHAGSSRRRKYLGPTVAVCTA